MIRKLYSPDTTVGAKLELDAGGAITSMKDFKKQVTDAKGELIKATEQFGIMSKEAAAAAKKVADLEDKMQDAKQLVDAFNPDTKFRAFGASIQTVVGGFTALTGAMGLLGVESEQVQKTLLKVQSALALSQGIAQLQEGIGAIKNLGSVLVQTLGKSGLIGIAIAGVAALGAALLGAFDGASKLTEQQKMLNQVNEDATKIYVQEKLELERLVQPLRDENTTRKEKQEAIDKLQSTYPGYFKNLGIESGHVVGLENDYKRLTDAMLASATARAANNLAEKELQTLIEKGAALGITSVDQIESLRNNSDQASRFIVAAYDTAMNKIKEYQKIAISANNTVRDMGGYKPGATATKTPKMKEVEEEYKFVAGIKKQQTDYEIEGINKVIKAKVDAYDRSVQLQASDFATTESFILAGLRLEENASIARKALADAEQEHKRQIASSTADLLNNVAELVGKETVAGKIMAIAAATINTYLAVTKALSAAPPPINFIMAASSLAAGLAAIKNIIKVQVPGKGGGGSVPSGLAIAPLQSQLPQSTSTRLDRDQLNQIGNAAVRAFVVESDVSGNQEKIRRLNRAARL